MKSQDLELEMRTRHELGILEIEKGHIPEATRIFQELRENAHQTGKTNLEQGALYELGLIAANHTHEFPAAREYFGNALRLAKELKLPGQAARCTLGLGDADYEEGAKRDDPALIESAARKFGDAAEAARLAGDDFTRATAFLRRIPCRLMLGHVEQALQDLAAGSQIAKKRGFAALVKHAETIASVIESAGKK
jgi:tetratricopeptide (TPR) repeat protein